MTTEEKVQFLPEEKVQILLVVHREVKIPYEENNGLPGSCAECSDWSDVDRGTGRVKWPCRTAKILLLGES